MLLIRRSLARVLIEGKASPPTKLPLSISLLILSTYIPMWLDQGYNVVVGADHGMSENGYHGGNSDMQRKTALYIIADKVVPGVHSKELTTMEFAPLLCCLLGIKPGEKMKSI